MPKLERILETALYFDDLEAAAAFYRDILGLTVLDAGPRLVSLDAGQSTVLLLFLRGATLEPLDFPGGRIMPHDGHGPTHMAFAIQAAELPAWERHLAERGVEIESRVKWSRGGESVYFRDPEGHSLELATPGVWKTY